MEHYPRQYPTPTSPSCHFPPANVSTSVGRFRNLPTSDATVDGNPLYVWKQGGVRWVALLQCRRGWVLLPRVLPLTIAQPRRHYNSHRPGVGLKPNETITRTLKMRWRVSPNPLTHRRPSHRSLQDVTPLPRYSTPFPSIPSFRQSNFTFLDDSYRILYRAWYTIYPPLKFDVRLTIYVH